MALYQFPYADLNKVLGAINETQKVFLPVDNKKGEAAFTAWSDGVEMSSQLNTLRSAKDFFFPQVSAMARFKREGQNIEIIDIRKESEDFVIFGARACDVRSFTVLDNVFLAEPVDTQYQTRREHSTVVTLACGRPGETCFCSTFDIDAACPTDGDARAWIVGDTFYLEPLTEKGEKLVEAAKNFLTEGDQTMVDAAVNASRTVLSKLPLANLKAKDNRAKELELFNSEKWAELSSHCLGCGACTYVCPTCQCFDINDFDSGKGIERYKCWDSCMFNDFTLMAAGTPRKTQKERFRQRFMHKLVYYPIQHEGMFSCVGCGRCLKKCPIQMNIVKVMNELEVTE